MSHQATPFERALTGFKDALAANGVNADFEVTVLEGDPARATQALEKAAQDSTTLLFTLGSVATRAAKSETASIPIIAGLVLTAEDIKGRDNLTGVFLEIPAETQLNWIKQVFPECRNIGIISNQARTLQRVDAAMSAARSLGLMLHTRTIDSPSDLPSALKSLRDMDVLWGMPDDQVFTPQTAKPILLFSFRNRVPLVGLSGEWVKAGALFALERDYTDLGVQCAEMAIKILDGTPAGSIPPAVPRKLVYYLNLKTADHMKITVPDALVTNADQLFR